MHSARSWSGICEVGQELISHHLLTNNIEGWANNRLVAGTDAALQHNLGLGGAVVVTVYKRADGKKPAKVSSEEVGKKNGLGYNPAVEAKGFTKSQVDKVRSKKSRSEWALQDIETKVESRF